ncbi:MAG: ATP-binding protein [Parafilimonas sp.]
MAFELIIIIAVIIYLRRSLQTAVTMPEWNQKLLWFMYAAIALIVFQFKFTSIGQWLSIILLSWLTYILYTNEKFKSAKFIITAIMPFLVVSVVTGAVNLISTSFYDQWQNWLDTANTFTIIWAFGTWFVTKRQQKELIKARKKAVEEEQNNKVITEMKAQLEVQVAERTAELTKQKEELEFALHELKATQTQLIQSEKMASLGELTAGIAHEIQNPLNFVNNFSEVNKELISELVDEVDKKNYDEVKAIANDIKENSEKINHHGKRAGDIVKGMLQHSRTSSGKKEVTDINALCDEYLRLSYHGLRAKDKSFNADFKTDFDEATGKINIIPQDIGRVILNLINNAFYAVNEKKKLNIDGYKPTISVQTKKLNNKIEIKVSDNGNGIPQKIVDKIFQPFFTTKPTGQGTGLGLSLSYDIIKAHGGEIKVETKVDEGNPDKFGKGEGTTFIIQLPII